MEEGEKEGRERRACQPVQRQGRGREGQRASEQGLISDIPLCVVIPAPAAAAAAASIFLSLSLSLSPRSLFLLPRWLSALFSLRAAPSPSEPEGKTVLLIHCDPILHQFTGRVSVRSLLVRPSAAETLTNFDVPELRSRVSARVPLKQE